MQELTALDTYYLVRELQFILNAKVDQIYYDDALLLRLHLPSKGKQILHLGKRFFFVSAYKEPQQEPSPFCMLLRKYLKNARIRTLEQVQCERIIKLTFEAKETYELYAEFFAKGNCILMQNKKIIASLYAEKGKRSIKKGENYVPDIKAISLLALTEEQLVNVLKKSSVSLVKTLAVLGLGGIYAEYVAQEYDKNISANEFTNINELHAKIMQLFNKPVHPSFFNNRIIPFLTPKPASYKTFNEAVAEIMQTERVHQKQEQKNKPFLKEKEKWESIIHMQKEAILSCEQQAEEYAKKGELIYQHYAELELLLAEVRTMRRSFSSQEIKKKYPQIKEIHEGEQMVVVEL